MTTRDNTRPLTIAVTGLNATDNPGPGVAVIRALREHPALSGCRIVGLAYDVLEPGIYSDGLTDALFMLPYPSQGREALMERLEYIHDRLGGLDVIIPTLDAELPSFIDLSDRLAAMGVGTYLPTARQFELRSKARLDDLGRLANIRVPEGRVIQTAAELADLDDAIPLPFVVKGPYYGAKVVYSRPEAVAAFHRFAAEWGIPIIAQRMVQGQELNVLAVGDGVGALLGAVAMKKTFITDKGKGWAGVTIRDPELMAITERFMEATSWRGPCELEIIRDADGDYHLIEVNPRLPAWCYLSAGAGMNLPATVALLALGHEVAPTRDYRAGTMFVRIAIDQIAHVSDMAALTTLGEKPSAAVGFQPVASASEAAPQPEGDRS